MTRGRGASVRAALLLASGFVVLRVCYRVVFGGAGGSGVVLLELPRIRLTGPFEHIALFGPVTTGGIGAAALSALPFAALILAVGLLVAALDVRALLARGAVRGPVRIISRALAIAWATFPALIDSVRRVRLAQTLRGERGVASLLVPVLEQTVERAVALGASMEVRGFSSRARAQPSCEHPAEARAVSLGYEGRWILDEIDLALDPSSLVLITGATGSGKSTLLHALSGLFQHVHGGEQAGVVEVGGASRIDVPPRDTSGYVGVVVQSPRLSFVAATVAEEIGFALANRGVVPVIVRARVRELAARLGIEHLLHREIHELSAGEACLVAIGAALVEQPILLLVDEPLAELDEAARLRVVDLLSNLAHEAGVCVVVAEHASAGWKDLPDLRLHIEGGTVQRADRAQCVSPVAVELPSAADRVAEIRNVTVSHADRVVVEDANLALFASDLVALRGPNGAGKSSLLHALARPTRPGAVEVDGRDVFLLPRLSRRGAVALVPESFDDLLFATTVERECRRADRRAGHPGTVAIFSRLLPGAGGLLDQHPRDLSAGQRLCLVIAIQLSANPRVLLVDEPSRGLDATAKALVGNALVEAAKGGAAVVFATHDEDFAQSYSTRTITMAQGRLGALRGVQR